MSRFGTPSIPQYGFHPRQYVLAESSDIPGEYPPPQPETRGYYQHSFEFVPPTVLGWVHQGDTQPSNGNVVPQSGERSFDDDTLVHFEESGPVAGPPNFQAMPGAHEQQPSAVDHEDVRISGPFPHQLHSLIEDPRAAGLIYWCPKGKEFIVPDSEELEKAKLLPKYFKHNNWSSVARQLGYHLFKKGNRAKAGRTNHVFSHPKFLPGRKDLLDKIKPNSHGRDSFKNLAIRLRDEMEQITRRLSRSEEDIVVLKKEKKALEGRNETLSAENRELKAQNKHLHDVNAIFQLPDLQKPTLREATSSVPYILPDAFQAAGIGYSQAGSGYTQAGSASLNAPNNYLPPTTTVQSPSNTTYTNSQSSYHQAPSLNPPSGTVYPSPPGRRMNVPVAMSVGSSGSWASQPHAQEANTVTMGGNQLSEPSDARQYAPRGPGFVHARGSVGQVFQQQPQSSSQGTWADHLRTYIPRFGSPSNQQ